jgi:hypothetical protein
MRQHHESNHNRQTTKPCGSHDEPEPTAVAFASTAGRGQPRRNRRDNRLGWQRRGCVGGRGQQRAGHGGLDGCCRRDAWDVSRLAGEEAEERAGKPHEAAGARHEDARRDGGVANVY